MREARVELLGDLADIDREGGQDNVDERELRPYVASLHVEDDRDVEASEGIETASRWSATGGPGYSFGRRG